MVDLSDNEFDDDINSNILKSVTKNVMESIDNHKDLDDHENIGDSEYINNYVDVNNCDDTINHDDIND